MPAAPENPGARRREPATGGHAVAARTALEPDVDRMSLNAIRCHCHIGVTGAERRTRQRIEIDLDLWADLEEAGRTADLACTIHYRVVADEVRALCEGRPFNLVEAMTAAVLDLVFARFPRVSLATLRVRKYVLPDVAHIEIAMERSR